MENSGLPPEAIRAVVAKVGLDGHDRGAKVIAKAFRDAGMEVIYTGLHRTGDELAEIVLQEDADLLGLSILSGAVVPLTTRVFDSLRERELDQDVVVLVGGIISADVDRRLRAIGVAGTFGPGATLTEITTFAENEVRRRRTI
jgi:methylmalonyl-CoA mutase C-terminal domain/subunit